MHGTTILCVRNKKSVVMMSDGQVTLGHSVFKEKANKLRKLCDGKILVGFAGGTADAFTLVERLEIKLEKYSHFLKRACIELAKDWRMDKVLRRLEAMLVVADLEETLIVSGQGDVISPEGQVAAIGSGGMFALASARAILEYHKKCNCRQNKQPCSEKECSCFRNMSLLALKEVAFVAMKQATRICIYTNKEYSVIELERGKDGRVTPS